MTDERADAFDVYQREHWGQTTNRRRYDHPVVRLFGEQRAEFIRRLLGGSVCRSALDVGCGDGFGMWHMRRLTSRLVGCDASVKMLRANPFGSALVEADAYTLPFADRSFDLVYAWELLHHVSEPERVVAEMARVASGRVLLCEPNSFNPAMAFFGAVNRHERGLLRFTPGYPGALLQRAGLVDIRHATVSWLTPNNTPRLCAAALRHLPYRVPMLGLYTIAVGRIDSARADRAAGAP